jgi:hypothetical protein
MTKTKTKRIRYLRTNANGPPGKYSCDRCGLHSPRGVYTGRKPYAHVCIWCNDTYKRLIAEVPRGVLGTSAAWGTYGATEKAERAKQAQRMSEAFKK